MLKSGEIVIQIISIMKLHCVTFQHECATKIASASRTHLEGISKEYRRKRRDVKLTKRDLLFNNLVTIKNNLIVCDNGKAKHESIKNWRESLEVWLKSCNFALR